MGSSFNSKKQAFDKALANIGEDEALAIGSYVGQLHRELGIDMYLDNNIKKGNKATEWTPSPEDKAERIFQTKQLSYPDYGEIIFSNQTGWVVKITKEGNFKFNHETKMNADEFAKEFINILEDSVLPSRNQTETKTE